MSANVVIPRGQQRITIQCTDADAPGIAAHASVADRDWVVNECSEHPHGPVGALDVVLVTGTQEWAWCPQSNNHAGGLFVPLDIGSHPVASYYWKNGYIDGGVSLYRRHHVLYRWTSLWIAGGVDEPGDMYSADGNWNDRELAVDTIKEIALDLWELDHLEISSPLLSANEISALLEPYERLVLGTLQVHGRPDSSSS